MTLEAAPIAVSVVEDDPGTRKAIVDLLTGAPALRLAGAHPSGEDALRAIPGEGPDVVLVDIRLPGMSGIECVVRLKALRPDLPILMLTTYEDSGLIFDSLRAGASGYLLKKRLGPELAQAIEEVRGGGAPMSMEVARKVVEYFRPAATEPASEIETLTPREQEVLALLAGGCLYKQIGDRLDISLSTVRTHLRNIYEKLHVQSRTEATLKFLGREKPTGLDRLKTFGRSFWTRGQ